MKRKILSLTICSMLLITTLFGCSSEPDDNLAQPNQPGINQPVDGYIDDDGIYRPNDYDEENETVNSEYGDKFEIEVNYSDKETITVGASQINSFNNEIKLNDETVTISKSGEYVLSGTISNGQIIVDVPESDAEVVTLILNGVDVTCDNSAPLYVKSADKVVLCLVDGTENTFTDGKSYDFEDETEEEPNACIFSKDDLVISGTGKLNVKANFNNGIASKDDLTITGGIINVDAVNNGIKGKDSIAIMDGKFEIVCGADGFKADNTTETEQGYIIIDGGDFKVESGEDAFQAETCMVVNNGIFDITTGEGASNASWDNGGDDWARPGMGMGMDGNQSVSTNDTVSMKALKAGCDLTINGGTFKINSEDDAMHTNVSIEINGGDYDITSGDDGIHADSTLVINGGKTSITQCYEGVEATNIAFNDGEIEIKSSDDGFNAAGGNDSSAMGGRPGMNNFAGSTGSLTFNGGYVYVNASGDGLDANGTLTVTDGYIVVDGPSNSGNGAFDYDSGCNVTGGFVLAVGAAGMAQMPNNASINCVMIGLNETISNGKLLNVSDKNGDSILTYSGAKSYNNVVLCTADLKTGESYTVSVGGTVDGDVENGIATGNYSGGTEYTTFTISSTLSTAGNANGGMGGMGGMNGMGDPGNMGDGRPGGRR